MKSRAFLDGEIRISADQKFTKPYICNIFVLLFVYNISKIGHLVIAICPLWAANSYENPAPFYTQKSPPPTLLSCQMLFSSSSTSSTLSIACPNKWCFLAAGKADAVHLSLPQRGSFPLVRQMCARVCKWWGQLTCRSSVVELLPILSCSSVCL